MCQKTQQKQEAEPTQAAPLGHSNMATKQVLGDTSLERGSEGHQGPKGMLVSPWAQWHPNPAFWGCHHAQGNAATPCLAPCVGPHGRAYRARQGQLGHQ